MTAYSISEASLTILAVDFDTIPSSPAHCWCSKLEAHLCESCVTEGLCTQAGGDIRIQGQYFSLDGGQYL